MLERVHLEILSAIKEHGTLTKAADSLYLSQSALSHSIKKLEGQIGTAIWQKEGRSLRLTAAGERIQTLATRLLPQFQHTELQLTQIAKGEMVRAAHWHGMSPLLSVVTPSYSALS